MAEERKQVLDMLAAGTITVEQAAQLLDALDKGSQDAGPYGVEGRSVAQEGGASSHRGKPALTPEQLAPLKALGINAAYVEEMRRALGRGDLAPEHLIPLKAVGISAAYVHELREAGIKDLTPEQIVPLKAVGVTAAYLREMRELGYRDLSPQQAVSLKAQGIDAAYVREMGALHIDEDEARDEEA